MVDTPGFADAIDNRNAFKPIIEYIDNQFEVSAHENFNTSIYLQIVHYILYEYIIFT